MKRKERGANKYTEMSSVGTRNGYGLNSKGSIPSRGKGFLFSTASRPALEPTLPPFQLVPGGKAAVA
jgi:hypothetical protein